MFSKLFAYLFSHPAPSSRPDIPYAAGNVLHIESTVPCKHPAFIGRSDILKTVDDYLSHPQQNAIVLYGQRRIGKTSILRELENELSQKGHYQPIYFDLMGRAQKPLESILDELATMICQKLPSVEKPSGNDSKFHDWLTASVKSEPLAGKSLVILFDEFDAIDTPQNEQVRDAFFHYLREKLLPIDPQKLNFVFAIGRNIHDFQSALVLLRTIVSVHVSLLTEKETEKLIRLSEANSGLFWSRSAVKAVWKLTQGHPYLTQLLCSLIWEQLWNEQPTRIPTVTPQTIKEQAEKNFRKLFNRGVNALEWLWQGLSPACKIDTAALAELGDQATAHRKLITHLQTSGVGAVIAELETAPRTLKEWDILDEDEQKGYRFRVELFRQWVVQYKPLKEVLQAELGKIRVEAQRYYQQAQQDHQSKAFDSAVGNLQSAIRVNPQFIEAHQLLAKVLIEAKKLVEAQTVLERFYGCCPEIARAQLTDLLWMQAGSCDNKKEQLVLCEKILGYDSDYVNAKRKRKEILQWQAKRFEEDEEYQKAIEVFQKAGLQQEVRRVWWKDFWKRYGKRIQVVISIIFGFLIVFFIKDILGPLSWLVWGIVFSAIFAFLSGVVPSKKAKRKRF